MNDCKRIGTWNGCEPGDEPEHIQTEREAMIETLADVEEYILNEVDCNTHAEVDRKYVIMELLGQVMEYVKGVDYNNDSAGGVRMKELTLEERRKVNAVFLAELGGVRMKELTLEERRKVNAVFLAELLSTPVNDAFKSAVELALKSVYEDVKEEG